MPYTFFIDFISYEVRKALKKMKSRKFRGVDDIACDMLRAGKATIIDWFTREANVCINERKVPRNWQTAVKEECKSYIGISLLSIPGKLYERVVIE